MLRLGLPNLRTEKGGHYGDILETLFRTRIQELGSLNGDSTPKPKSPNGAGDAIDKALLAIATPRRVREKDLETFVGSEP